MKLLRIPAPTTDQMATLADCVAHRCTDHLNIPPLNMSEGNGSSECGVCSAEEFGARLAEQALETERREVWWDILDAYAQRMEYQKVMRARLQTARDRLNILSPGAGDFLDEVL